METADGIDFGFLVSDRQLRDSDVCGVNLCSDCKQIKPSAECIIYHSIPQLLPLCLCSSCLDIRCQLEELTRARSRLGSEFIPGELARLESERRELERMESERREVENRDIRMHTLELSNYYNAESRAKRNDRERNRYDEFKLKCPGEYAERLAKSRETTNAWRQKMKTERPEEYAEHLTKKRNKAREETEKKKTVCPSEHAEHLYNRRNKARELRESKKELAIVKGFLNADTAFP